MKSVTIKIVTFLFCIEIIFLCQGIKAFSPVNKNESVSPLTFIQTNSLSSTLKTNKKIEHFLHANHVNGSVYVEKNGVILFNNGVGFANFQRKVHNTASTTFGIGSITKSIVAASVMKLQEEGRIRINEPVIKYIPDFPNGQHIKLVNLLSNTSGVGKPFFGLFHYNHQDIIHAIKRRPIQFKAGTQWDYQDANYMIVGYIIEKITKMPLHKYIQRSIFAPSGIRDASFIPSKRLKGIDTTGYIETLGTVIPIQYLNTSILFACGDIIATTHDISLFDQALMTGKIISKKSLEEILTPRSSSNYGLGLYIKGKKIYSRGVVGGWESFHEYNSDSKTSIVILLNKRNPKKNIRELAKGISSIIN